MPDMPDRLPSKDDLDKLSHRGMVCYALRSALRVVHLTEPFPDLHEKSLACIEAATRFCTAPSDADIRAAAEAAEAAEAARVTANAADAARAPYTAYCAATFAAEAANAAASVEVVDAATDAFRPAYTVAYTAAGATKATNAAANAAAIATHAAGFIADDAATYANADFEQLLKLTGHQAGEIGDPIEPGEDGPLGPLWPRPEENQELLKAIEESDPEPVLTVYFDESSGLTPENELLFLKYLNALYQEQGGVGLKIISDKQFQYKEVLVDVYG